MTSIIILAAGKSRRMGGNGPKVLQRIGDHTLIEHLLEGVEGSRICKKPIMVVGYGADQIKEVVGQRCEYVFQEGQLGTGHAVSCAREALEGKADNVMILYGDHPFLSSSTIRKLNLLHEKEGCVLSMMTLCVMNFDDWRAPFADFGRVIRDESGRIIEIVEKKDATEGQLKIREGNPSFFCFKADWLWKNIDLLENNNAQKEYYLTDLVGLAIKQGHEIASVGIDPFECLGVNTPEHLEIARRLAH